MNWRDRHEWELCLKAYGPVLAFVVFLILFWGAVLGGRG